MWMQLYKHIQQFNLGSRASADYCAHRHAIHRLAKLRSSAHCAEQDGCCARHARNGDRTDEIQFRSAIHLQLKNAQTRQAKNDLRSGSVHSHRQISTSVGCHAHSISITDCYGAWTNCVHEKDIFVQIVRAEQTRANTFSKQSNSSHRQTGVW